MAIQIRRGADNKYDVTKMYPGELAVLMTSKKVKVVFSDGTDKEFLLVEDAESLIIGLTDDTLDSESDNPVANSAVTEAINEKLNAANPSGSGSLSIGRKASTTVGNNSIALGSNAEASNTGAVALGAVSKASGAYSLASGRNSIASGQDSVVIGYGCVSEKNNSVVLGQGNAASNSGDVVVGKYNKPTESGETNRVFEVGTGSDSSNKRTSFFIDVNGDAVFCGKISAPMFTYDNGEAVQIGVDGDGNPVKRMTVYGTDTSGWGSSGQTVMELESKNILVTNMYGYVKFSDGANRITAAVNSVEVYDKNVVVKIPSGEMKSSTAKYCVTVEYILLD